jgi:hypothetical protein
MMACYNISIKQSGFFAWYGVAFLTALVNMGKGGCAA